MLLSYTKNEKLMNLKANIIFKMRKIFHLTKKEDASQCYYSTLVALVRDNHNLGVSKATLDRFDFSKPFENSKIIIIKSVIKR